MKNTLAGLFGIYAHEIVFLPEIAALIWLGLILEGLQGRFL